LFFFSSRRRHTRFSRDWSSDVCSSDLELRNRLTAPPACRGNCAEIMSATVRANGERLDVELAVSALADVAVALPQAGDRWQLEQIGRASGRDRGESAEVGV